MKRGSVVVLREPGSPASKSRPCIVVQNEASLAAATKITAVPLTSELSGVGDIRPLMAPSEMNGLRRMSEAQADWIFSFDISFLGTKIGEAEPEVMSQLDQALRRWLSL